MKSFRYHRSDNPVRVGDRILVRGFFFGAQLGTVVYVPGQVAIDPELGDDQWAYKTDDGTIYAVGYAPAQLPHASKRIEFVSRPGHEADEVIKSYKIPPEEASTQPGRDFLALVGCATILAITALSGLGFSVWLAKRLG